MQITCSHCQARIRVPDSAAGKRGKCPKCNTIITIPTAAEAAAADAVAEAPSGSPFDFGGEGEPEEAAAPPRRKGKPAADEVDEVDEAPAEVAARAGAPKRPKQESTALSITSLVLGILSLLCGCGTFGHWCVSVPTVLLAIGAIVTGIIGRNKGGATLALVGMIGGGLSLLLAVIGVVVNILLLAAWFAGANVQNMQNLQNLQNMHK